MICYIKDYKTFATTHTAVCTSYEIHESIYDAVSTISMQTPNLPPNEGDFVMFDGNKYVGIITEVETDNGLTTITAQQGLSLFSRPMFYSTMSYTYLEDNLQGLIYDNFTNCTDAVYKIPFLTATATTHNAGSCKPDLEDNVYTISSYISKLRRLKSIVCDWGYTNTALTLDIHKKTFPTHNIDLSNPRYRVTEETLASCFVGKITVYAEDNSTYYTRYLLTDGTITSSYQTTNRVDGEWITKTISDHNDLSDEVADAFAQNTYSHRITFQTDRNFELYDKLVIRTEGKMFSSYVCGVIKRNDTDMIEVECGELQTQYPFKKRL